MREEEIYNNLIELSEKAARSDINAILNEFFFFCTFTKDLPSQDYIYRQFTGNPYSKRPFIKSILKGVKTYLRTIIQTCFNLFSFNAPTIIGNIRSETDTVIVSWLHDMELLENNKIDTEDRYFGDLGLKLRTKGHNIQYLLFPDYSAIEQYRKYASKSADLSKYLMFFGGSAHLSLNDLTAPLNSIVKSFSYLMYSDEVISYLTAFHSIRYILSCQLKEQLTNIFRNSNIKHIFIPWESQPEQKAICLSAHKYGIKVWGYCHAAINGSYVHLINNNWQWCPDILLTNGISYVPLLEDMGWKDKILVIRSLRYSQKKEKSSFIGKAFLPYDIKESLDALNILYSMITNGECSVKEIKCHPDNLKNPKICKMMDIISRNVNATDIYVGGFSSIIFEALQAGCTVYNILTSPLNTEKAYRKFNKLKMTRIKDNLLKFEPLDDLTNYFFCFDEERSFKMVS